MINTNQLDTLLNGGGAVIGDDGAKIGKIGQIFLDDETGAPEWVTTKTGLFGSAETFVPLAEATASGDDIRVPYSKDKVKDAPNISDENGHLDKSEEATLYRFYGLTYNDDASDSGLPDEDTSPAAPAPTPAANTTTTGNDAATMTRSEEQVHVGTERVSAGKARLRKYVVTENVTKTVPVSHEEVRIEHEPITDANRADALSGDPITSDEQSVDLTAEKVVVDKETVPVERVRMDTQTVTEQEQVDESVRKEQIDTDTTARGTDTH